MKRRSSPASSRRVDVMRARHGGAIAVLAFALSSSTALALPAIPAFDVGPGDDERRARASS
jgi:hypothetical protein